jgi:polyferredoxin
MAKTGRKPGLIAYQSEIGLDGGRRRRVRVRTVLYAVVLVALATVLVLRLGNRALIEPSVMRTTVPAQTVTGDGPTRVRQIVPLSLVSRDNAERQVTLSLVELPEARLTSQSAVLTLHAADQLHRR